MTVLFLSNEIEEFIGLCDRVVRVQVGYRLQHAGVEQVTSQDMLGGDGSAITNRQVLLST